LSAAQAWAKKYETAADIPDSELPTQYDFRSIHDYDFTTAPRDQGHCGSCYTFGFIQAIEARLRLKTGKEVPKLSAQQVLSCNFLNEGCDGGWPHLNGYFMEHAHFVEESCAPYK
jgi:C1A family cysteine protease